MNPVAQIVKCTDDSGAVWDAIVIWCPAEDGLHMLPVNSTIKRPQWAWDGDLASPTLSPSILTRYGPGGESVCHSFLNDGVWEFLGDCTHEMAGQRVPMVPLPDWVLHKQGDGDEPQ